MTKYRKKPIVIDAFRWDGKARTIADNVSKEGLSKFGVDFTKPFYKSDGEFLPITNTDLVLRDASLLQVKIDTLEGYLVATKGDYIIKGVRGEYYSCKPDVFVKTYERVEELWD